MSINFGDFLINVILLIKTTAARNEVALSYHRVRGQYFLAVVFVANTVTKTVSKHFSIFAHPFRVRL